MSTRHYRDDQNNYVGGFGDGAEPPPGAIEVDKAPNHGTDKWKNNKWEEDPIEKEKRDKKKAGGDAKPILFDALLDLLGPEFDDHVTAYRASKV